jgi:hypothetical protein
VVEEDQRQRTALLGALCFSIVVFVVAVVTTAIVIIAIGRGGGGEKTLAPCV